MTLQELHDIISKTLQFSPRSGESHVGVVVSRLGIGRTPTVAVAGAYLGFDWNSNSFMITTEIPVIELPEAKE
jgi:hypothetical protein